MIHIRMEAPGDQNAIYHINQLAFGGDAEPKLVNALRMAGNATLSLVAEVDGLLVGHILFSPMTIETERSQLLALGLAPLAVLPDHQNKGIGSELVKMGLKKGQELGWERSLVLGHPKYYPRFGYQPAHIFGIRSNYKAPLEAFMALALREGALNNCSGLARYAPQFDEM